MLRGTHASSFCAGPNATKRRSEDETGQFGVYNESGTRTDCVLNYVVHEMYDTSSGMVVGAVFEMLRDNRHTVRVGLQHCTAPGSIAATGLLLHVVRIPHLHADGFRGRLRVTDSTFRALRSLSQDLGPVAPTAATETATADAPVTVSIDD